MESLLRQLAGDHPPGVMPDKDDQGKSTAKQADKDDGPEISAEEEEAAWQKAIEMMLSGEGLEALGLDKDGQPKPGTKAPAPSAGGESSSSEEKIDFNETIRRTMEQLKNPSAKSSSANGTPDLEALLAQLGNDPRMAGLGDLNGEDEDLGGLLDGMMAQLMTKEVLEEPMSELASKVSKLELLCSPTDSSTRHTLLHHPQERVPPILQSTSNSS
jgi:peroxin-19